MYFRSFRVLCPSCCCLQRCCCCCETKIYVVCSHLLLLLLPGLCFVCWRTWGRVQGRVGSKVFRKRDQLLKFLLSPFPASRIQDDERLSKKNSLVLSKKKNKISNSESWMHIDTLHGNGCHVRSRQRRTKKISSSGRSRPCLSHGIHRRSKKEINTWDSHLVPHGSTNQASGGLASKFGMGFGALHSLWSISRMTEYRPY